MLSVVFLLQSITELNELRKAKGGVRDAEIIGMQNEHYKDLQQAEKHWLALKSAFEKNVKKGKVHRARPHLILIHFPSRVRFSCKMARVLIALIVFDFLGLDSWIKRSLRPARSSWSCWACSYRS